MDFQPRIPARQAGLTLLELLVTLTVTAILGVTVVPAMLDLIDRNRISASLNELVTHIHLARSQAIKNRYRAILCPSNDGRTCLRSGEWHHGFMLFDDNNGNRKPDPDERVIRFRKALPGVTMTSSRYRNKIVYQSNGMAGGTNLTITICGSRAAPQAIILSNTGRPRTADKRPDGKPLKCP